MAQFWQTLWMSKKSTSYLDIINQKEESKQKFNLFDFSSTKTQKAIQTPQLNFWQPVSQKNTTNFNDFKSNIPKQTKPTPKSGFSLIPTANAGGQDLIQSFLDDNSVNIENRKTVFEMLKDNVPKNIIEDAIINKAWYKLPQPIQEEKIDINKLWLLDEAWQRMSNLWKKFENRAWETVRSWQRKHSDNPFISSAQSFWTALNTVWNVIWWAFDIGWEWIAYITPDIIKEGLSWAWKEIWGHLNDKSQDKVINAIKAWWEAYTNFKKENPFLADALEWAWNIANVVPIRKWTQIWAKAIVKWWEKASKWLKNIKINNATKKITKWEDILFEAVNPTTRENKAVLKQRVQDLIPYIEKNPLKNSLEDVKARIDTKKSNAWKSMENYETNIWVKWEVDTAPIIKQLESKYQEKIWTSFINPDEAKIAQQLIETLKGFWDKVTDANIIKIRRAWDWIIDKNKWFMQSAEANSKWDIFADANKFFREEIKKSNPEYASYLQDYHKTKTLSDVLEATIQRRVWQTKWWFIARNLQNIARVWWSAWWIPWYLATEALIQWSNMLASPWFKLARGTKLIRKWEKTLKSKNIKNGVDSNVSSKPDNNMVWGVTITPISKSLLKKPSILSDKEKALIKNLQWTTQDLIWKKKGKTKLFKK